MLSSSIVFDTAKKQVFVNRYWTYHESAFKMHHHVHLFFSLVLEECCPVCELRLLPRDGKAKKIMMSTGKRLAVTAWISELGSNGLEFIRMGCCQGL